MCLMSQISHMRAIASQHRESRVRAQVRVFRFRLHPLMSTGCFHLDVRRWSHRNTHRCKWPSGTHRIVLIVSSHNFVGVQRVGIFHCLENVTPRNMLQYLERFDRWAIADKADVCLNMTPEGSPPFRVSLLRLLWLDFHLKSTLTACLA